MIAPSPPPTTSDLPVSRPSPVLLPSFRRLLSVAGMVNLPVLAVLLLMGHLKLAYSEAAGFVVSVLVCGLLYLLVGRGMAYYVGSLGGRGSAAPTAAATAQMAGLLLAKFLVLGLAAYAVISLHGISLPAVLGGFLITHAAIVITATRHLKEQGR